MSTVTCFDDVSLGISEDKTTVVIGWNEGHTSRCSTKWLRFHCQCSRCRRTMPAAYPLNRSSFHDEIRVESADIVGSDFHLTIDKEVMDNHVTKLPLQYLLEHCNCDSCIEAEIARREIKPPYQKNVLPTIDYEKVTSDYGLFECLQKFMEYGFCVIKHFPTKDNGKEKMMRFLKNIGSLKPTFYGENFDVIDTGESINAAYTKIGLPFHQDLPMYESSPGVQILLAMRFDSSVKGGMSKLVDLMTSAIVLRKEHPKCFETLCRVPATFETKDVNRDSPAWFEHTKPHIEVDYFGKIVAVNWHPGTEGALRVREEDVDPYYEAHKTFFNIINKEENQFVFRLDVGDMLIFNNHRMAHSRTAFVSEKSQGRHLFGCYIDLDDLKSKYMVLAHKLGIDAVPPKVFNRSSF